jgi:glutaryl-CoA dehydrogenase
MATAKCSSASVRKGTSATQATPGSKRRLLRGNNAARFFADAEALYSYEGTYQMLNLIVGKAVTGLSAFV